jgi:hypothetical protein
MIYYLAHKRDGFMKTIYSLNCSLTISEVFCGNEISVLGSIHLMLIYKSHVWEQWLLLTEIITFLVQTEWNTIQSEIVPILLPTFFANNTTNSVLHQLWTLNPEMVTRTMVEMHASDPSYISRILDVCQELKVPMTSSLIDGNSCLVKTVQCLIKIAVLKSLRNHCDNCCRQWIQYWKQHLFLSL